MKRRHRRTIEQARVCILDKLNPDGADQERARTLHHALDELAVLGNPGNGPTRLQRRGHPQTHRQEFLSHRQPYPEQADTGPGYLK